MMEKREFTIFLDLQDFFSGDRSRAKILISPNYKNISDLEARIAKIFAISNFHLLSDGHYLPSGEDIALIKDGETLRVRPTPLFTSTILSEIYYTNSSKTERNKHEGVTNNLQNDKISIHCNGGFQTEPEGALPHERAKYHSLFTSTPNNKAHSSNDETNPEEQIYNSQQSRRRKKKSFENETLVNKEENFEQKTLRKRKREVAEDKNTEKNSKEIDIQLIRITKETSDFDEKDDEKTIKISKNKRHKKSKQPIQTKDHTNEVEMNEIEVHQAKINMNNIQQSEDTNSITKEKQSNINIIKIDIIRQSDTFDNSSGAKVNHQDHTVESPNLPIAHCETNIEITNYEPKPLRHKKVKDGKSWSTSPLLKTTNLVKIIKVPSSRIEIDDSRFVYSRREALLVEKADVEVKNSTISQQDEVDASKNTKEKPEAKSERMPEFDNEEDKTGKNEGSPSNCDEKTSSVSVNLNKIEEGQDTQKNKARELWRKKLMEKTVANEENDTVPDVDVKNVCIENNNFTYDSFEANTNEENQMEVQTMADYTSMTIQNEDDSSLSYSTVTDTSQFQEIRRKRKRRHKKKIKNDKPSTFVEEAKNIPCERSTLVLAKPKIHIKFDDTENNTPEVSPHQENIENSDATPEMEFQSELKISSEMLGTKQTIQHEEPTKNHDELQIASLAILESLNLKSSDDVNMALDKLKSELLKTVDAMNESFKNENFCVESPNY